MNTRAKGYLITALGVAALSPDGLLTRFISVDGVMITFWRTLLYGLTSLVIAIFIYRIRLLSIYGKFGWLEFGAMGCYGVGNLLFMYSITHTTVANTLFMLSTTPIWAALFAWLIFRERVPRRTWFAIAMVVLGITIITRGSDAGSGALLGDLVGLLAAGTLALQFSLIRQMQSPPMPVLAMGGVLTALVIAGFIDPATTPDTDLVFLIIMSVFMLPIANGLLYLGPKYLPAPEVGLMMLMETVLGPLWVWLVVNENPGIYSIAGGTIVLLTLLVNTWLGLREESPAITAIDTRV